MKGQLILILVLFIVTGFGFTTPSRADDNFSKGQASIELLGSALLYNLHGSYRPSLNTAINLGVSILSATATATTSTTTSSSLSLFQLPISFSYLMGTEHSFFEMLGGLDFIKLSGTVKLAGTELKTGSFVPLPEIGLGYRYWPLQGGFHFRAILYVIFASSKVLPWPGVSFGVAF